MRCHICDSIIHNPVWNAVSKAYEPCASCLSKIFEAPPAAKEDTLTISLEDIREAEESFNGLK